MSNIVGFKPKSDLEAREQLGEFIAWAKATLPKGIPDLAHESIQWGMSSWHSSGINRASFSAQGSPRNATDKTRLIMQPPFIDFAKAIVVYVRVFLRKNSIEDWLGSLRALEAALFELKRTRDVTQVSASVCNRASELLLEKYSRGRPARYKSLRLEQIIAFMEEKGLLANPFQWSSPLVFRERSGTLEQQRKNSEKRLPSRESIQALGELFNNNLSEPLDIVVTSACAILLGQPSRVGELGDVEHDCILYKDGKNGSKRMFLKWYAEKGYGATTKPVVTGMESVVERAVERVLAITHESRSYAAWLEDHPNEFPPHEHVPEKGLDEPLTYEEACSALKYTHLRYPRSCFKNNFIDALAKRKSLTPEARAILNEIIGGWDTSIGRRFYAEDARGIQRVEHDDKAEITLRKLNVLVRERYLPKFFPYTTPPEDGKDRVKYRDALFTMRTGELAAQKAVARLPDFGVEIAANPWRMTAQLSGAKNKKTIFERHGYKNVRANTHSFRHELNTEMHRAGLSQLLIDAFSGRTSMGSVYNHETIEERTQAVADVHPKTKQDSPAKRLEKIRTNTPLSLSDVTDLVEGAQDRIIHQTHLGLCVHNFASEPCPKMGSCLKCGALACVKGDDAKLKNLKEERSYLKGRYDDATAAAMREEIGASEWVKKVSRDLIKCEALINLLEDPKLDNGDIVWNADDGWNLTNNASHMAESVDTKIIEGKGQKVLPSLERLSAILDDIEV